MDTAHHAVGHDAPVPTTNVTSRPRDLERTAALRRRGLAVALGVGPWGFVLANGSYAWMTRHGGDDLTSRGALALTAAHPLLDRVGGLAAMVASLLMVPAVLGLMRLVRTGAARLGLIAGGLMIGGYVCYFAMVYQSFIVDAMIVHGGPTADSLAVLDAFEGFSWLIWVPLFFVAGNIIGTFLMALSLRRTSGVPRLAAYGVMAWPVLHIVGLAAGTEWFEVCGAMLQSIGMLAAARYLLTDARQTKIA